MCNKTRTIKRIALMLCVCLLAGFFAMPVSACYYYEKSGVLYCKRAAGCNDDELSKARHVVIDTRLTGAGAQKLSANRNLESLTIKDMSNLSDSDRSALYPYLVSGNIALAAVLFAYEDYYESFGNDGTPLYREVIAKYSPSITTLRSCASVVSAAINAAGMTSYSSAATAGLVEHFEESSQWVNMGAISEDRIQPGDIVFIDRKSHAAEYASGELEDPEYKAEEEYVYEYKGGYDSTGHKNYETQDPTGSSYEVFCPDQDGDGEVGEWEAEYWRCYWERVYPDTKYVPPYDYYYRWEEEAKEKEAKEKAEKEAKRREENADKPAKKKSVPTRIIHDHIFVWTGNEIIRQVFPDSTGNIISGSYTENYKNARSAAVSKYNFTGDFRVYRYIGDLKPYEMTVSDDEIPVPVEALKQETWKHGKEAFKEKGSNSWLRIALARMRMEQQRDMIETTVLGSQSGLQKLEYYALVRAQGERRLKDELSALDSTEKVEYLLEQEKDEAPAVNIFEDLDDGFAQLEQASAGGS